MRLFSHPPRDQRYRVERLWSSRLSPAARTMHAALVPLALGYEGMMAARAGFWRVFRRKAPAGVRVISVGNLTVGGNAKTPFTLYLARALQAHGMRVGIVSRGYRGSKGGGPAALVSDGQHIYLSGEEAGDEALMVARSFRGPVAIAKRRIDAIRLLQERSPVDAVVLDDAFQHLRLARDLDLLLVNAERGFGNGWVLPAGPLRERCQAAARAHAVVVLSFDTGAVAALTPRQQTALHGVPALRGTIRPRSLVFPDGERWREAPGESLGGRRVMALSGIADSRTFYAMLRELEADLVGVLEYPDHHRYTASDWREIRRAAATADLVVTTEKDLVKLVQFSFARNEIAALRLEIDMGADEARLLALALGQEWKAAPPTYYSAKEN